MANLAAIRAASAEVEVILNDRQFRKDLQNVERQIRTLGSRLRFLSRIRMSIPTVEGMLKGLTKMSTTLKTMGDRIKAIGTSFKEVGNQLISTGIVGMFGAALPVREWLNFSDAMQLLKTKTGASVEQMQKLEESARAVGADMGIDPTVVANGFVSLAKAGVKAMDILDMAPGLGKFSKAIGTDLERAGDLLVNTANQFKIPLEENARLADVITATVDGATLGIEDYAEAMKVVGLVAKNSGDSFESTSAAIAMLADAGLRGTEAGNGLKRAYLNIATPEIVNRFNKLRETLGASEVAFMDANHDIRPMADIMQDLGTSLSTLGSADRLGLLNVLFGGRGVTVSSVFAENVDKMRDFRDTLKNANGLTEKTAATMEAGIGGALRRGISAARNFGIEFGKSIDAELIGIGNAITEWIGKATKAVSANKELVVGYIALTGALLATGASMVAAAFGIQLVGRTLVVFGNAAGVITKVLAFGLTTNFGALIIAVGLAGAAFMHFTEDGRKMARNISQYFSGLASRVKGYIGDIGSALQTGNLTTLVNVATDILNREFAEANMELQKNFGGLFEGMRFMFEDWGKALVQTSRDTFIYMSESWNGAVSAMGDTFGGMIKDVEKELWALPGKFSDVMKRVSEMDAPGRAAFFKDIGVELNRQKEQWKLAIGQGIAYGDAAVYATQRAVTDPIRSAWKIGKSTLEGRGMFPGGGVSDMAGLKVYGRIIPKEEVVRGGDFSNLVPFVAGVKAWGEEFKKATQAARILRSDAGDIDGKAFDQVVKNQELAMKARNVIKEAHKTAVISAQAQLDEAKKRLDQTRQAAEMDAFVERERRRAIEKRSEKPEGKAKPPKREQTRNEAIWMQWMRDRQQKPEWVSNAGVWSKVQGVFTQWAAMRVGGPNVKMTRFEQKALDILKGVESNTRVTADELADLEAA